MLLLALAARRTEQVLTVDAGSEVCDEDGECERPFFTLPTFPLGKVELAVGVIVAPGLTVRGADQQNVGR